jgi:2-polyprenyl-3-methyl-5-hydroxy-6-metoxy-1,4-benzoquinol methylase
MERSQNYDHKTEDYFNKTQEKAADFVSGRGNRILEIGCGEGYTGAYLKQTGQAKEVHGIELVPEVAESARKRLDSVLTGDLETIDLPFEMHSFDYIIGTETLEHLAVPERVLSRLKPLLKPEGLFIASVPNMRHIRLIWHLAVEGDWRYRDSGPLDRTHMRFFTRKSFIRLFTDSGYQVTSTAPVLLAKAQFLNRITFGLLEEFLAYRYYCIAKPKAP